MTESQDTCDPLIATLLRALVARSGGHITVTTHEWVLPDFPPA